MGPISPIIACLPYCKFIIYDNTHIVGVTIWLADIPASYELKLNRADKTLPRIADGKIRQCSPYLPSVRVYNICIFKYINTAEKNISDREANEHNVIKNYKIQIEK